MFLSPSILGLIITAMILGAAYLMLAVIRDAIDPEHKYTPYKRRGRTGDVGFIDCRNWPITVMLMSEPE